MQKNRCTVLSGWMTDAIGFMIPVNVFPSVENILHGSGWLRQGLVAYYRLTMLQVLRLSNPALARAVAITSCILMATHVSAAPARTPNAVAQIRSILHAQQNAWNRGDIDGFMNGYARSASTVFISEDSIRRGWETVRARYRQKYSDRARWGHSVFPTLKSICCHLMRLWWSAAGNWSGQRIARTGASHSFSNACQRAGELCTIIRRRRHRDDL